MAVPGRFETRQATGKPLLVQVEVLWLYIWEQTWWYLRYHKREFCICKTSGCQAICSPTPWKAGQEHLP